MSLVALDGGQILAGGSAGVSRSKDGGSSWLTPTVNTDKITDLHAFGRSALAKDPAYVGGVGTALYYTEDAGDHWKAITSAPVNTGRSCGGIAFLKTVGHLAHPGVRRGKEQLDIYYSNECGVSKLVASRSLGETSFDYSGAWLALTVDHSDTRDLAFDSNDKPMLLGTDGGLHHTTDGGLSWTYIGGGHNGYNALQITEVQGQWIDGLSRHDLYFGTQDNDLWSSKDSGATWQDGAQAEGFAIELLFHVPTVANDVITFTSCWGCGHFKSGALFSHVTAWPDPPGPVVHAPKIVAQSFHVQGIQASALLSKGLAFTINLGTAWHQYATLPDDLYGLPKLSWIPRRTTPFVVPARPVLYQAVIAGRDPVINIPIIQLARIVGNAIQVGGLPPASVTYPAMNNFGGLGLNKTEFDWYQVFAVDPGNPNHLIAPDVINEKIMQTLDGGDNWSEIPLLTSMVTNGGLMLFRMAGTDQSQALFPLASSVSFNPDDPNMVALGTWENGFFLSADGGETWTKMPNSDSVPHITAFDWPSSENLIVSSYGRGLWWANLQGSGTVHLAQRRVRAKAEAQAFDRPVGKTQSPMAGKPYVKVTTHHSDGDRIAAPGQVIELAAHGYRAEEAVEIALDGRVVEKTSIGPDGSLTAKVVSPKKAGIHALTVRDAATGKVMDGSVFLVRSEDPRERDESKKKP